MKISEKVAKFSHNLLQSSADLVLFRVYLGAPWKTIGSVGERFGGGDSPSEPETLLWSGLEASFPEIPQLTPPKIARALRFLLKGNFVELSKSVTPVITEAGGARLDQLFPVYQKERKWDGQIYLVNYDVPVGKNSDRDALRLFLKNNLGCALLQSSVWVTPYDPSKKLDSFAKKRGLRERVAVSVLLGKLDLAKVYGLDELNRRYQGFIRGLDGTKGREGQEGIDRMRLAFDYFAVLKADPQIPFELLPKDWLGDRAQELFEGLFFGR